MGAQQSSARGDSNGQNGSATVAKTCYYEVLGIDRQATEDEIKKAYRRKALELHPDRNYGDTESATIKFAEVQSAYQVLSDPQERSWYDAHRESILRGGEGDEAEDHFEHNVRLTSARDIVSLISRFNPSISFSDAPNGFYGVLRDTFTTLAKEEEVTCNWEGLEFLDYPDFGGAKDDYETVVKPFYGTWINFSTQKTFSWNDAYRPSDAPDRQTRRLIEKENKRLREAGIREFNDAVRSLVAFVRKRDPRYLPNTQSVADREKILRDAAAAQRARARANNQAKLNKHTVPYSGPMHEAAEEEPELTESEDESEVEQIECVVCGKTFKSEKQYEAHEKSKKHIKAVQQIQREMRKENKLFNLDDSPTTVSGPPVTAFENLEINSNDSTAVEYQEEVGENKKSVDGAVLEISENGPDEEPQKIPESQAGISDSPDSDDEYASRKDVEDRLVGFPSDSGSNPVAAEIPISATSITVSHSEDDIPRQKLGKAKVKRAKKAARQEKGEQEGQEFKCAECNESFASKTKLFGHIKDFDHAQPVPKAVKGKKRSR